MTRRDEWFWKVFSALTTLSLGWVGTIVEQHMPSNVWIVWLQCAALALLTLFVLMCTAIIWVHMWPDGEEED